jgi:hypothetical protein
MTQTLLQLNPPLLLVTDEGRKCQALLLLDYGPDWPSLFLVGFDDSRELWWLDQRKLRITDNISLGRMPPSRS